MKNIFFRTLCCVVILSLLDIILFRNAVLAQEKAKKPETQLQQLKENAKRLKKLEDAELK